MSETWLETRGTCLRYCVTGNGRHSLVMFHGLTGSIEIWETVAQRLEGQCRVVRADQRGAGLSEKVRAPYEIGDLVEDGVAVIEASGAPPPYVLCGHASGAAIAVGVADMLAARVSGLVLCAPALGATPERARLLLARSEVAVREGMRAIIDDGLSRSYPPDMIRDRAVYEAYRARFLAIDPVCYGAANRVLATVNLDMALARLSAPCLLVAGQHDLMRPPQLVAEAQGRIANAEMVVIDSGHIMPLQAPAELASAISRFITRLQGSET